MSDETLKKYSPKILNLYDRERHIGIEGAYGLVDKQSLDPNKLYNAVNTDTIHVYEFGEERYLDRLDIGRVFHGDYERKGLNVGRYFTDGETNPFETVGNLKRERVELRHTDGSVIFEMDDAEFPESWSDIHKQIVAQKFLYKPYNEEWKRKLEDRIGREYEYSFLQLINRVTNFIADEGEKLGYFETIEDKKAFVDELNFLQVNRMAAFNSPIYFNAGLFNEYNIEGSHGINYWRDPETGEVNRIRGGCNIRPQGHACFIKSPRDDLESIMKHTIHEGGIFSSGSGIGQNIGVLRGEDEPLSSGGVASGPLSYLKFYDDLAGCIKSGGKSRRAARFTGMRGGKKEAHPDIMKFIRSKVKEDKKALTLMEAGYSGGMEGEAYSTVTFQNTNLSVRIDKEFFEEVEKDGMIELRRITDGKVVDRISAKRMLQEIAFGAWRIGDPGVQYETPIQEMNTCKNSGRINASNPCSEYMFLDDTSCNLASTNLLSFTDKQGNFNVEAFIKANRIFAIATDIINDAASYPVEDIARNSPEFRCIGIGYSNLGSLLMRKGLPYDSEEGRALAAAITSLMTGSVYETSVEMAEKLGPFVHWEFNREPMLEVMSKHRKNLEDITWEYVSDDLKESAYSAWENVIEKGKTHGFRNAQATVLAPTGTISYLMGCDTTGVEPAFAIRMTKSLAGGGKLILVNNEVENALENLGYELKQREKILSFIEENNTVFGVPYLNQEHYGIFDTARGDDKGRGYISLDGHIKMLSALQPFISGAISKTCNSPESATVKDFYDGFLLGNKLGVKAIAAFRDNGKPISVLTTGEKSIVKLQRGEKEDLHPIRNAYECEVEIGPDRIPFHIITSEYGDGRPGQIAFLCYKAGSTLKALLEIAGIQVSKSLKRGVKLEDIVSCWLGQQFEPFGLVKGHPNIKTALSPLDFAAKFLLLEYKGETEYADDRQNLKIENLRGAKSGAFETYKKMEIDDWDIEQVLMDPKLGGFVTEQKKKPDVNKDSENNLTLKSDKRGRVCKCGRGMKQTSPGCWTCICGETLGGCGA